MSNGSLVTAAAQLYGQQDSVVVGKLLITSQEYRQPLDLGPNLFVALRRFLEKLIVLSAAIENDMFRESLTFEIVQVGTRTWKLSR